MTRDFGSGVTEALVTVSILRSSCGNRLAADDDGEDDGECRDDCDCNEQDATLRESFGSVVTGGDAGEATPTAMGCTDAPETIGRTIGDEQ